MRIVLRGRPSSGEEIEHQSGKDDRAPSGGPCDGAAGSVESDECRKKFVKRSGKRRTFGAFFASSQEQALLLSFAPFQRVCRRGIIDFGKSMVRFSRPTRSAPCHRRRLG